jgi:hypothetical protein
MKADLPKVFQILNDSWMKSVTIGSVCVVDELVAGTNTRSPVRVYIPRKPHPNGHLIYFIATQMKGYWFILNCCPYLDPANRPTPTSAFISLIKALPERTRSNVMIVGDSAFCTKESVTFLHSHKIWFTLSAAAYPSVPLKELAEITTEYKDWNVSRNSNSNILAYTMVGTKFKHFKLISNSFQVGDGEDDPRELYKDHFNGVDLFNRNFYFFRSSGRHCKYTHVILDDILSMALANSWALYHASNPNNGILKKDWAKTVAEAIFTELFYV